MSFNPALYDGSDPTYAPLTSWRRKKHAFWRPSQKYIALGASGTAIRLVGEWGDGRDDERAAEARRLTREMLKQFGGGIDLHAGTWAWLIYRYRTDAFSPMRDVKQNTRENYDWLLDKWTAAIGHMQIAALDYEQIMTIRHAMRDKGRSDSLIRRMFVMLRTVAKYGSVLKEASVRSASLTVSHTLSVTRFKTAPKRSAAPTPAQIRMIVNEADARGLHDFAAGILLQWWLNLRAVDVRGQWFKITAPEAASGGLTRTSVVKRGGKAHTITSRWQDGLTWDMIEGDLSSFRKVVSKTEKTLPEPQVFRLDLVPELQARLRLLGNKGRVGPVILSRDGMPYTTSGWGQTFSRLRDACGVPSTIWMMDTRAGSITDAIDKGATTEQAQSAAVHSNPATTQRYIRGRDEAHAKVIQLRSQK